MSFLVKKIHTTEARPEQTEEWEEVCSDHERFSVRLFEFKTERFLVVSTKGAKSNLQGSIDLSEVHELAGLLRDAIAHWK